jgi:hypothetical protein
VIANHPRVAATHRARSRWSPMSPHPCTNSEGPRQIGSTHGVTKDLFGRAPAPAPRAAPAGALPNSGNCTGFGCGAGAGAPCGFQRGGGATFWWLHWLQLEIHQKSYFAKRFLKRLNSAREATPPEENQSRSRFRMSRSPAKHDSCVGRGRKNQPVLQCTAAPRAACQHASVMARRCLQSSSLVTTCCCVAYFPLYKQ